MLEIDEYKAMMLIKQLFDNLEFEQCERVINYAGTYVNQLGRERYEEVEVEEEEEA